MHRKTLAAVALSLCTAAAVVPTTAAAAPAAAITDGTSNTLALADAPLTDAGNPSAQSINFTKVTYHVFITGG